MVISGKELSAKLKAEMAAEVATFGAKYGRVPHLVVILVGEDPGSVSYVTGKAKASAEVGIRNTTIRKPESVCEAELLGIIADLNADEGDSRDGENRIHAVRYTPDDGNVRGIVQIVHGMAEYVERYENLAEFLTKRGILVTGEDHLGHGKSVSEGGSFGYFCEQDPATVVVRDVHRLKKITEEQYPQVPYIILGHSMGSFIARNYLCRYGSGIDGAVIVGTGMQSAGLIFASKAMAGIQKLFCGSKHVSHFIDKAAFGGYNKRIDSPRTSSDWLSRNTENVDRYIEDELCGFTFTVNGFQTLFELIRRLQKQENLEKVPQNLPILMVSGAEDPVGDYGKGVHKACDSLKRAGVKNITVKLYENDRHELLNEDDAEVAMEDIWQWICKEIPGVA